MYGIHIAHSICIAVMRAYTHGANLGLYPHAVESGHPGHRDVLCKSNATINSV